MLLDNLCSEEIVNSLSPGIKSKIRIDIKDSVESTNDVAKQLARSGEEEGYVLISRKQTKGKGRLGRSFFSPNGTGVYMSLLLRPTCPTEDAALVTTAAAVAVCQALECLGVEDCAIKWVNDIYVKNKKVCGILCESGYNGVQSKLDYVILGVGLNMYLPEGSFPEELKGVAGAVFELSRESAMNTFVAEFINSFFRHYNKISERAYINFYRKKCFVLGKEISLISADKTAYAKAIDIDENCNLIIENSQGEKQIIGSGEISVRVLGQLNQ